MKNPNTVAGTRTLPHTDVPVPLSQKLGEEALKQRAMIEIEKERYEKMLAKVFMQMKSEGRVVMVIKAGEEKFRFELTETEEKLVIKKAK